WFLFSNFLFSLIAFLIIGGLLGFIKRPWELDLQSVSSYLDLHLENLEYSTGLLLLPREELSGIAKLQQEKTSRELETEIKNVSPQDGLLRAIIISAAVILLGFLITKTGLTDQFRNTPGSINEEEIIVFKPADSVASEISQPQLLS